MSNNPYSSPTSGMNVEPHRANTILILGILSIICCNPLGIAAILMANGDMKKMQAGTMDRSGESTTNIGKILGIIGLVLMVVGCIAGIAIQVLSAAAAAGGAAMN